MNRIHFGPAPPSAANHTNDSVSKQAFSRSMGSAWPPTRRFRPRSCGDRVAVAPFDMLVLGDCVPGFATGGWSRSLTQQRRSASIAEATISVSLLSNPEAREWEVRPSRALAPDDTQQHCTPRRCLPCAYALTMPSPATTSATTASGSSPRRQSQADCRHFGRPVAAPARPLEASSGHKRDDAPEPAD